MNTTKLHLTAAYKPAYVYGGPTMSVAKLCEGLINADQKVRVFTTTANGKVELDIIPNSTHKMNNVAITYFKRITKDHTHFSPALLKSLVVEIKRNKQLIIHIHAWWNLVSVLGCLIAKWNNVPVVLSPRGMVTSYTSSNRNEIVKNIIHRCLGKRLLKYCHFHVTSQKEKEDVLSIIKPKSITVIPNLVELSIESPISTNQKKSDTFNILFLSRIEEKKGIELLLNALSKCAFNWQLNIAGEGTNTYISKLKNLASELNITEKINWLGHINNAEKFKLMAQHDLLALTSYNENFANVVIESLSVGTAVLLSNQVGLYDYVAKNNLGWITELNIQAISKNLEIAFIAVDLRNKIRLSAPELIKKDFSDSTIIHQYLKLYQDIENEQL